MSDRILVFEIFRGDELLRTERIERDIVKIGSLPTSHLRLEDPQVSSIHAVVEVSGEAVHCIDLGSASGTRVNGNRINKCQLNDGDVIEFGLTRVVFRVERPKPQVVTAAGSARPGVPGAAGAVGGVQPPSLRHVPPIGRASEARYGAKRPSQALKADGTVEVVHLWRDHVMSEVSLKEKEKALTIGSDSENQIVIDHPSIPSPRHALVSRTADRSAYLHLGPKMEGEVFIEGVRYEVSDAIRMVSGEGLKLTTKTRARLTFGESTLHIHPGTQPPAGMPWGVVELNVIGFALLSLLLHSVLVGIVYMAPESANWMDLDNFDMEETIADIAQLDEEPPPEELPEILQEERGEQEDIAAREQGDEGRAGVENEVVEDRRMAVEGPPDNTQVTLSRRQAEELAVERGVLSLFQETPGPQSLFGDVAMGYDDVSAAGALYGDTVGVARGFGGLGISGGGFSGGGDNPGGFGVGPIATRGLYGAERDDLGRDLARGLRDRGDHEIEVELGQPSIEGHLDREIIQRVVREHRREIRDCYQRELQRNQDLSGRIVVAFTIDPQGNVARAEISETDLNNSEVEECVARRFRRFVFPEPTTPGLVHVFYPFVFTGGGGGQ